MNDQRLQSTPEDVFAGRAVPAEMLHDFLNVASLDEATCSAVAASLRELSGLADAASLRARITDAGVEGVTVASLIRTVKSIRPNQLPRYLKMVAEWVQGDDDRAELFTSELFRKLQTNLGLLIQDNPAIELMQKSERLLRDVGNEIEDIKFVCDLRPVFDIPRENVEGLVLVTTLRLIYQCQTGERQSVEIAFSEDELESLSTKLKQAQKKLSVIKNMRSTLATNQAGPAEI